MPRIFLSPPHLTGHEMALVTDAIESNWIAPAGPHIDSFERELAERVGVGHAAGVSSGTAALHLAMRLLGVGEGDEVYCPTFTFVATASAITYQGARPVFLDSDRETWTLDVDLLRRELQAAAARGRLPKAVVGVDLYGQTADWEAIDAVCGEFEVPVVEDAAEALGATHRGRPAGGFGRFGVFSFNGNKIITASGGGMLVSNDEAAIAEARKLSSQARDEAPHYEHSVIGYNYRMSNILAAIGRGQLRELTARVAARQRNFARYHELLADLPGIRFMPEAPYGESTRWLTTLTIDQAAFGATREDVRLALAAADIEARPTWKPMHLQPVFRGCRAVGGEVAESLFEYGLCLPSGTALTDEELQEVAGIVRAQCQGGSSVRALR